MDCFDSNIEIGDIVYQDKNKEYLYRVLHIGTFHEMSLIHETDRYRYLIPGEKLYTHDINPDFKKLFDAYNGPWAVICRTSDEDDDFVHKWIVPLFIQISLESFDYYPYKLFIKNPSQKLLNAVNKTGLF